MSLDHPVHPATVHFPIAFLTAAFGLDALTYAYTSVPSFITSHLPTATELSRMSYYALGAGVLTALPAASSGITQAIAMVKTQGLYEPASSPKAGQLRAKAKVLISHALVNDVVIAASAYLFYKRRQTSLLEAAEKVVGGSGSGYSAYEAEGWMVAIGLALSVLLAYGANLGGTLVYNHGFGIRAGKSSAKKGQ